MHFHRSWSPHGYDRATALFVRGYYDHSHFFRVVPHFLVQFGISYTTDLELTRFADSAIQDDPKRNDLMPFREGMMSFAGSGKNSRTSQLFIAYDRAQGLGNSPWETPFGEVVEGIEHVKNLYAEYGDMPPWGKGPEQGPIRNRGASYIEEGFPLLDKFETCTVRSLTSSPDGEGIVEEGNGATVGAEVKTRALRYPVKDTPKKTKPDAVVVEKQSPVFGKIVLISGIAVVLMILGQILSRRKKDKVGKSV